MSFGAPACTGFESPAPSILPWRSRRPLAVAVRRDGVLPQTLLGEGVGAFSVDAGAIQVTLGIESAAPELISIIGAGFVRRQLESECGSR